MSRPSEHGGGEAAPPIAGQPESFPSDAELARTLVAGGGRATLCTMTPDGYPYGSAVSYVVDDAGSPIVLVSEMAEHTVNARGESRASMLMTVEPPPGVDPLSTARLTLVGHLKILDDPGRVRDAYLDSNPGARYYVDFTDFSFWRLEIERCRYVGGFGHMSWAGVEAYAGAQPDPIAESVTAVIEHMNEDHSAANLLYAKVLAGLDNATDASMIGVDRYGVTLDVTTTTGPRQARLAFETPLTSADDVRPAVVALVEKARAR